MTVVLAVLAGGLGTLVRAEVTARLGVRRGTTSVNLAGTLLAGFVVGLVGGADVASSWLVVVGAGLAGGMTTVSTWMLDAADRPARDQVPSVIVTLLVGMVVAGIGWIVGGAL